MERIEEMSGTRKAAALLVVLGRDVAAEVLKNLDDDSIEKLTVHMSQIDALSAEEKEELLGSFIIELRRARRQGVVNQSGAAELLHKALGEEKAKEILTRIEDRDVEKAYRFIHDIESEVLAHLLEGEYPQTIVVALSFLAPAKAAEVLTHLSADMKKTVAVRLAKMQGVRPEVSVAVAKGLKNKYQEYQRNAMDRTTAGGMNSLLEIMNHMDITEEDQLLGALDESMPQLAEEIRDQIFTFENVVNLDNTEIRLLIDELNDDEVIAVALKGAGDEIRFKFLRNMSQNRATDILNEMDYMGPIPLSEVNEARSRIMVLLRMLHERGVISLKRSREEFVE